MWPSTRVTQSSLGGLPASRTDRLSGGPSLATNTHPLDIRPLSSVKLNETVPVMAIPTRMGMVRGMIWGGLIGLNPVLGMVAGRRSWSRQAAARVAGRLPQGAGLRNRDCRRRWPQPLKTVGTWGTCRGIM